MPLYGAIDLHSNNIYLVVSDEKDQVVLRRRELNLLEHVLGDLEPFRGGLVGGGRGIDLQLVLVSGRADGSRLPGALGQHGGGAAVRRDQVHQRLVRRTVAGAFAATGAA